jgi:hypothetical protein
MAFRFETANERWKVYKQSIMEHPQHAPSGGMGNYLDSDLSELAPGFREEVRMQETDPLKDAPLYMSQWDDKARARKAVPIYLDEGIDYTVGQNGQIIPSEEIRVQLGDEILTRDPEKAKMWGYSDEHGFYVL